MNIVQYTSYVELTYNHIGHLHAVNMCLKENSVIIGKYHDNQDLWAIYLQSWFEPPARNIYYQLIGFPWTIEIRAYFISRIGIRMWPIVFFIATGFRIRITMCIFLHRIKAFTLTRRHLNKVFKLFWDDTMYVELLKFVCKSRCICNQLLIGLYNHEYRLLFLTFATVATWTSRRYKLFDKPLKNSFSI